MKQDISQNIRPTPWLELRRFGLRKAFLNWHTYVSASIAVGCAASVPYQGTPALDALITMHGTLLGFTLTVFGFVILGGKDDFFEPVMQKLGPTGVEALRTLVLDLFFPVILQAACLALCLQRRFAPVWFNLLPVTYAWRFTYAFLFIWANLEIYHAVESLFMLAIRRILWRSRKGQTDSGQEKSE